jgi:hypothetical protein
LSTLSSFVFALHANGDAIEVANTGFRVLRDWISTGNEHWLPAIHQALLACPYIHTEKQ